MSVKSADKRFELVSVVPVCVAPVTVVPACVVVDVRCVIISVYLCLKALSVKTLEKQVQQKKDLDPVMAGILEEVSRCFFHRNQLCFLLMCSESRTEKKYLVCV